MVNSSEMIQMAEFRVAIMSTCINNGQYSTTRPRQWEQYHVPTVKLEPSIGIISPVMNVVDKGHSGKADQWTLASGGSEHA